MRIFVDMDNTLCDFNEAAVRWFNGTLGCNKKVEELTEYEIWKNYDLYPEEGRSLNKSMFETDGFWRNMEPLFGSLNVLKGLSKKHDIWIVSRPQYNYNCVYEKWEWVKVHLPGFEKRMILMGDDVSCLSGDALIDDDYKRLVTFQGKRIMFRQYYNTSMYNVFGYYVHDWKEVGELFNGNL